MFLNADSTNHLAYIIGHELGHTLRMDDPALWHKMGRELWPLVRKWREYKDSYDDVSLSDKDKQEELLSDVIGHNFADPAFWDDMAKQNQPMFQRIAAKVIELLDKAISVFGGRDVTVYITDMKKARSIVANAMAHTAAGDVPSAAASASNLVVGNRRSPRSMRERWLVAMPASSASLS